MAILKLYTAPHPVLRKKAEPVVDFDKQLQCLVADMFDTMEEEEGAGLAANQVGVLKQIFIMDIPANMTVNNGCDENLDPKPSRFCFINPEIIQRSPETIENEEGCLSIPGQRVKVRRNIWVTLKWQDETGNFHEKRFENWQAICVQHEYDHLEGRLSFDYLSPVKRDMVLRKSLKVVEGKSKP